jgi:hypothetical protein
MEFNHINKDISKNQGNIGVSKAIYEYTRLGYTVLLPFSDSDKYDLVIDNKIKLLKVQVKTSRCKAKYGGYQVNLKTSGGNTKTNTIRTRQIEDYDILFVLTEDGNCWSIPSDQLGNANSSTVVGNTNRPNKYSEYKINR